VLLLSGFSLVRPCGFLPPWSALELDTRFSRCAELPGMSQRSSWGFSSRRREMDWNRVEGNWKQAQGKIKEKWGKLTDDDLTKINGQREQLEGMLQQRYGLARDMVRKDIDAWLKSQP